MNLSYVKWSLLFLSTGLFLAGILNPLCTVTQTSGSLELDVLLGSAGHLFELNELSFAKRSTFSLFQLVQKMFENDPVIATILLVFSILFPFLKLLALFILLLSERSQETRIGKITIEVLERVGGWSFLDVLVVVVLFVVLNGFPFATVTPRFGMLYFIGGVLMSMIVATSIAPQNHFPSLILPVPKGRQRLIGISSGMSTILLIAGIATPSYALEVGGPFFDLLIRSEFPDLVGGDGSRSLVESAITLHSEDNHVSALLLVLLVIVAPLSRRLLQVRFASTSNPKKTHAVLSRFKGWSLLLVMLVAIFLSGAKKFPLNIQIVWKWGIVFLFASEALCFVSDIAISRCRTK